jgi:hypothetical protein
LKYIFKNRNEERRHIADLGHIAASVMNMKASVAGEVIDLPFSVASLNSDDENIRDLDVVIIKT